MNIVNNETKENITETCSGEDKGGTDENKIVPINKAGSAESENAAPTAELAAQLVARYASQPLAQAVGQPIPPADSQVFAQAANQPGSYAAANQPTVYMAAQPDIYAANQNSAYHNAPPAAQAQLAIHAAGLSAGQPAASTAAQITNLPVTDTASRFGFQPVTGTAAQTGSQPAAGAAAQTESQPAAAAQPQSQPGAAASTQAGAQSAANSAFQTGFANISDAETASDTFSGQTANAADYMETESDNEPTRGSLRRRFFRSEPEDDFDFDEEERPKKRFFRFRSASEEESRDKLILSRIKDEDLMEYLALEQRRIEFLQQAKEAKEKRILIAFQLLISLAAIVAITYLLQDNPTILISILYIVGIVAALNVWKNPHDKGRKR